MRIGRRILLAAAAAGVLGVGATAPVSQIDDGKSEAAGAIALRRILKSSVPGSQPRERAQKSEEKSTTSSISFSKLKAGQEIRVTFSSHGCFHQTQHLLTFLPGKPMTTKVVDQSRHPRSSITTGALLLRPGDEAKLDNTLLYYSLEKPNSCTTYEKVTVELVGNGAVEDRSEYQDDSCFLGMVAGVGHNQVFYGVEGNKYDAVFKAAEDSLSFESLIGSPDLQLQRLLDCEPALFDQQSTHGRLLTAGEQVKLAEIVLADESDSKISLKILLDRGKSPELAPLMMKGVRDSKLENIRPALLLLWSRVDQRGAEQDVMKWFSKRKIEPKEKEDFSWPITDENDNFYSGLIVQAPDNAEIILLKRYCYDPELRSWIFDSIRGSGAGAAHIEHVAAVIVAREMQMVEAIPLFLERAKT